MRDELSTRARRGEANRTPLPELRRCESIARGLRLEAVEEGNDGGREEENPPLGSLPPPCPISGGFRAWETLSETLLLSYKVYARSYNDFFYHLTNDSKIEMSSNSETII